MAISHICLPAFAALFLQRLMQTRMASTSFIKGNRILIITAAARSNVPVYFLEDEEIDFDKALRDEKVILPKMVSWHAHWLAVEGIQPLTIDNPPRPPLSEQKSRKQSPPRSVLAPVPAASSLQPGAQNRKYKPTKNVLSRELQIYYSRLNAALLPTAATNVSSTTATQSNGAAANTTAGAATTATGEDGAQISDVTMQTAGQPSAAPTMQQQQQAARRAAALASLQYDAGLQNLLPYIVRWVGQSVVTAIRNSDGGSESERRQRELTIAGETLEVMLKVIHALIQNERLFIEPYVRLHHKKPPYTDFHAISYTKFCHLCFPFFSPPHFHHLHPRFVVMHQRSLHTSRFSTAQHIHHSRSDSPRPCCLPSSHQVSIR